MAPPDREAPRVYRESRVSRATSAQPAHLQVNRGRRARLDNKARPGPKVCRDLWGLKAREVQTGRRVIGARRDQMENKGPSAKRAMPALPVTGGTQGQQFRMEQHRQPIKATYTWIRLPAKYTNMERTVG